MKYFLLCAVATIAMSPLRTHAGTSNTWGEIRYTQYQESKVYAAPVSAAAILKTLAANEAVKADYFSGEWCAIFRPSETVRTVTNAVGYMKTNELFIGALPPGPIAGGVGEAPPIAFSIEKMRPMPPPSRSTSFASNTVHQSQPQETQRKSDTLIWVDSIMPITGNNWFGCTSKEYFSKLGQYARQKDHEAFQQAYVAGVVAGMVTEFKNGEEVYIVEKAFFLTGLMKVRRKGGTTEYWTNVEAVKN